MGIFLQARPPQWWPHQQHAAAAAAVFYSAKSKQGLGLGGFASSGGPGFDRSAYPKVVKEICLNCKTDSLAGSSTVLAGAARNGTTCAWLT